MNLLAFSLTCFFNAVISLVSMLYIHKWLTDSGIDFLGGRMFSYPLLISLIFGFLIVLAVTAFLFPSPKLLIPIYLISIASAISCILIGTDFLLQPHMFFVGYRQIWEYYLNTAITNYVQNRLGCCGYNRPNEFANDNCTADIEQPCLKKIIAHFSTNIQIGGIQFLFHGISFGLLIYFARMAPCPTILIRPSSNQSALLVNQNQQQNGQIQQVQSPQNHTYASTPQSPLPQSYITVNRSLYRPPQPILMQQPVRPSPPSAVLSFSQQPKPIQQQQRQTYINQQQRPLYYGNQQRQPMYMNQQQRIPIMAIPRPI